jgi:hypothetical protein
MGMKFPEQWATEAPILPADNQWANQAPVLPAYNQWDSEYSLPLEPVPALPPVPEMSDEEMTIFLNLQ